MNNKKTRLVSIIFVMLNIALAFLIIYINFNMMSEAKKLGDKLDATFIIYPREIPNIEIDETGNLFIKPTKRFEFVGNSGPVIFERGESEAFHLMIKNYIGSWMIIASAGFVLSLFGIYYNSIHRLTCYGYVLGAIVCLLTVLGIGVLDGLHIFVGVIYIVIAVLIYREKERKIKKVKPVIPLDQLS